jgi:hypothetical protein
MTNLDQNPTAKNLRLLPNRHGEYVIAYAYEGGHSWIHRFTNREFAAQWAHAFAPFVRFLRVLPLV